MYRALSGKYTTDRSIALIGDRLRRCRKVVITMTDTGTQERQELSSAARTKTGEVQDERDAPTPTSKEPPPRRNRNENLEQYFARLDTWAEAQTKNAPKMREGEPEGNWLNQYTTFINEIYKKVTDTKLKEAVDFYDADASVQKLLDVHKGLPKLQPNTKAESSLKNDNRKRGNDDNDEEVGDGTESKKPKGSVHKSADISNLVPFDIPSKLAGFEVNFKRKEKGVKKRVKSVLSVWLGEQRNEETAKLSNFNESSPSVHILHALKDVLSCLGLGKKADVAQEMSFFSMRPDIVVLKYMDVIVLIIEVKNEGRDAQAVMGNESAAGQCLDYTYALKRTNIDTPIVCLSTYTMMRIGSSEPSIEPILSEAIERLNKVTADTPFGCISPEIKKPDHSPEKKGNATNIPCDEPENTNTKFPQVSVDEAPPDRKIYFSETFDLSNMFKALYLAVACGCISAEVSQAANGDVSNLHHDPIPAEGDLLKNRWYNVVQKDSYTWTKVSETRVTYALKTYWPHDIKVFMGDVLGMGKTGKVYLCMDGQGRHFALKMLFGDSVHLESYEPEKRNSSRLDYIKEIRKILRAEAERWKIIYPEYEKSIWEGTLNEQPCLAMPYIASIPKGRRGKLRRQIQEEMERLAELGFVYNKEDTRWRHIGLRKNNKGEEKIIFVDMESLQEVDEKSSDLDRKCIVTTFMKSLYSRSGFAVAGKK